MPDCGQVTALQRKQTHTHGWKGPGGWAWEGSVGTALAEEPGSVPGTHAGWLTIA